MVLRSCRVPSLVVFLVLSFEKPCLALEDGLARTPPMGYRTWNSYAGDVNQELMLQIADFMASEVVLPDYNNKKVRLIDFGYKDLGLDDNWQACGAGYLGSFHDENGRPIVDTKKFPDMKSMNEKAHSLGLTMGWYLNNCICSESKVDFPKEYIPKHYSENIKALLDFKYDSVKLDACGPFLDLDLYQEMIKASGHNVMIENCHWGGDLPTLDHCPYHMYRSSPDIRANWNAVRGNFNTLEKFGNISGPLSRPGCWAYPDMLEVGNMASVEEDKAHFAMWCISSSPLILSFVVPPRVSDLSSIFDVSSERLQQTLMIVTNEKAIGINQAWAGNPGTKLGSWSPQSNLKTPIGCRRSLDIWGKPLPDHRLALLAINDHDTTCPSVSMEISLKEWIPEQFMDKFLPSECKDTAKITFEDVWDQESSQHIVTEEKLSLGRISGHSASFILLTASCEADIQ